MPRSSCKLSFKVYLANCGKITKFYCEKNDKNILSHLYKNASKAFNLSLNCFDLKYCDSDNEWIIISQKDSLFEILENDYKIVAFKEGETDDIKISNMPPLENACIKTTNNNKKAKETENNCPFCTYLNPLKATNCQMCNGALKSTVYSITENINSIEISETEDESDKESQILDNKQFIHKHEKNCDKLNVPQMLHSGFECNICNKILSAKNTLKNHLLIHTGEKPFECEFCHKKFRTKHSLKRHIKIHTNPNAFKCIICNKQYQSQNGFYRHNKSKH